MTANRIFNYHLLAQQTGLAYVGGQIAPRNIVDGT